MRAPLVDRRLPCAVALALAAAACGDPGGSVGELGNGRFFYTCVTDDDAFCAARDDVGTFGGEAPPVPDAVVVGSIFDLDFEPGDDADDDSLGGRVECALDDVEDGENFRPTRPGWLAFVAERSDGVIVDLVHVQVVTPSRVDVTGVDADSGAPRRIAVTTAVTAVPRGADGGVLFGSAGATWTSSDDGVVAVHEPGLPGVPADGTRAELLPTGGGEATITVTVGGVATSFDVLAEEASP